MSAVTTDRATGAGSTTQPRLRPTPAGAVAAVYAGQLARVRVARGPLVFVAVLQSVGILLLLRGVVGDGSARTASWVVAGSAVLVVGFVALNLLAQRFGQLRAARALDYYAALPVAPGFVVLGTAAAYATIALPGVVVTTAVGAAVYDLPMSALWVAVVAAVAAGVALSGCGAALGLVFPRPELATVAGQLAMTLVLFVGVIPPDHLPLVGRVVRDAVPSTYAVDALAAALRGGLTGPGLLWRVAVSVAFGVATLVVATLSFRRAVER